MKKTIVAMTMAAVFASANVTAADEVFGDSTNGVTVQQQIDTASAPLQAELTALETDLASAQTAYDQAATDKESTYADAVAATANYNIAASNYNTAFTAQAEAQANFDADPSPENQTTLDTANNTLSVATSNLDAATFDLNAAEEAYTVASETFTAASGVLDSSSQAVAEKQAELDYAIDPANYTEILSTEAANIKEMQDNGDATLYDKVKGVEADAANAQTTADQNATDIADLSDVVDTKVDQTQYDADKVVQSDKDGLQDKAISDAVNNQATINTDFDGRITTAQETADSALDKATVNAQDIQDLQDKQVTVGSDIVKDEHGYSSVEQEGSKVTTGMDKDGKFTVTVEDTQSDDPTTKFELDLATQEELNTVASESVARDAQLASSIDTEALTRAKEDERVAAEAAIYADTAVARQAAKQAVTDNAQWNAINSNTRRIEELENTVEIQGGLIAGVGAQAVIPQADLYVGEYAVGMGGYLDLQGNEAVATQIQMQPRKDLRLNVGINVAPQNAKETLQATIGGVWKF